MAQYVSFSDESYSDKHGLKSIASFSFKAENLSDIDESLRQLLNKAKIKDEFKWQYLKDFKYQQCAVEFIERVWELINTDDARVDIIIWDINDSRHRVKKRDDLANYERMFYHLHSNSLKRRPKASDWKIYPDEGVGANWGLVSQCLEFKGQNIDFDIMPLLYEFNWLSNYEIVDFKEVSSKSEPCCQVADLFAGMGIFSKAYYSQYKKWESSSQLKLPILEDSNFKPSNSTKHRFPVLQHFYYGCKSRKLGVSLDSKKSLYTPHPNNPINFWHYEPQHEMDKAPTKQKRSKQS